MKTPGDRIRARREELKLSQQDLIEKVRRAGAKISQQALSQIEDGTTRRSRYIPEIALALNTTERWILTGKGLKDVPAGTLLVPVPLGQVMVVGAVQAGVFREALQWPEDDWKSAPVSALNAWKHLPQFGLDVRGPSMNRIYPDGSTVICVNWWDAGLENGQLSGKRVVVLRRDPDGGGVEATVKEIHIDEFGVFWLWPKSTDPNYQTPWRVESLTPKSDDNDDIRIAALVIGAFVPEAA